MNLCYPLIPVRDALDEYPLSKQEQNDHRHHGEQGGGHGQVPVGLELPSELRQPQRQRPYVLVLDQVEERRKEVVPRIRELEQRDRSDGGLANGTMTWVMI